MFCNANLQKQSTEKLILFAHIYRNIYIRNERILLIRL